MANVISSLRTVQARLLAVWQMQQAAIKTRQQAAQTDTSRTTTSFRALVSGKAASATLPATQGCPLGPARAAVAAVLPATQGCSLGPAPAAVAATLPATQPTAAVAADAPAQNTAPTAESVFGANPWITNPTGTAPDGSSYGYNPLYFATAATAAQVAQMVGGKVVASDQLANAGGFVQQQPNEMVQLANGRLVNAGLVASFYTHGYPQSYIDQLIANEVGPGTT